jgi:hypothetical protein
MATPALEDLRALARRAGLALTDDELAALAPAIERALAGLAELDALPLGDAEPAVHYRVV